MEREHIQRISELTAIARTRALTDEERLERETLRRNYLMAFRSQFKAQLDNTVVEYPDGSRESLRDAGRRNSKGDANDG